MNFFDSSLFFFSISLPLALAAGVRVCVCAFAPHVIRTDFGNNSLLPSRPIVAALVSAIDGYVSRDETEVA